MLFNHSSQRGNLLCAQNLTVLHVLQFMLLQVEDTICNIYEQWRQLHGHREETTKVWRDHHVEWLTSCLVGLSGKYKVRRLGC